jgi:hypothetical protein
LIGANSRGSRASLRIHRRGQRYSRPVALSTMPATSATASWSFPAALSSALRVPGNITSSASQNTTQGVLTWSRPALRAAPRLTRRGTRTSVASAGAGTGLIDALSTTTIACEASCSRTLRMAAVNCAPA